MDFTHRHRFDAPLEAVVAMLADREFVRRRGATMGARVLDADVDGTTDTDFQVTLRREAPTSSIPAEFRGFVGASLVITYVEAWEAPEQGQRIGTFAVEILGAPGHVSGAIGLTDEGETTELLATGKVTVPMPLVGPMIEKALVGNASRLLDAELAEADAWLAERA